MTKIRLIALKRAVPKQPISWQPLGLIGKSNLLLRFYHLQMNIYYAIALALQMNRPIYVAPELMAQRGMKVSAEIENFPLARGLTDLKIKQAEALAKHQARQERLASEETAGSKHVEQNQKLMSFLLGK